jgi:hypothetical protein
MTELLFIAINSTVATAFIHSFICHITLVTDQRQVTNYGLRCAIIITYTPDIVKVHISQAKLEFTKRSILLCVSDLE